MPPLPHKPTRNTQAGKAVGSGVTAVAIATRPFKALSPGALAMDKLVANLKGLVAFLEVPRRGVDDEEWEGGEGPGGREGAGQQRLRSPLCSCV